MIESLSAAQHVWRDDPWQHDVLLHAWDAEVVKIPELAAHRAWIEEHQYGFGHRSFHWAWWLFAKEKSSGFKFLEVGVHKGQSLSAVDLAAHLQGKTLRWWACPRSTGSPRGTTTTRSTTTSLTCGTCSTRSTGVASRS